MLEKCTRRMGRARDRSFFYFKETKTELAIVHRDVRVSVAHTVKTGTSRKGTKEKKPTIRNSKSGRH